MAADGADGATVIILPHSLFRCPACAARSARDAGGPADFWLRQGLAAGLACLYPALLWIFGFLNEDEKAVLRFRLFSRRPWALSASSQ